MSNSAVVESRPASGSFRHEALFYDGAPRFVDAVLPFLREGIAAREPALVVVDAGKIAALRGALGGDAARVTFADMAVVGANPGRIIPAWREFLDAQGGARRPVRGIGEPVWSTRPAAELAECHRHEALLNVAFEAAPAWQLVCPYDTVTLPRAVLEEAQRTHPFVREGAGTSRSSAGWVGTAVHAGPCTSALSPAPPPDAAVVVFEGSAALARVRGVAIACARQSAIARHRVPEVALVVGELAANSVRHGGGEGRLTAWSDEDGALICEVQDRGVITDPLAGRVRPVSHTTHGRGLWMANQLSDLVQIRAQPEGSTVRVVFNAWDGARRSSPGRPDARRSGD